MYLLHCPWTGLAICLWSHQSLASPPQCWGVCVSRFPPFLLLSPFCWFICWITASLSCFFSSIIKQFSHSPSFLQFQLLGSEVCSWLQPFLFYFMLEAALSWPFLLCFKQLTRVSGCPSLPSFVLCKFCTSYFSDCFQPQKPVLVPRCPKQGRALVKAAATSSQR